MLPLRSSLLILAVLASTAACGPNRSPEPAAAASPDSDEAGAHKAHEAYVAAINANKLESSVDTPRADGPAKGTPVVTDSGNGVNIYRRDSNGVWRVARDVWATDRPRP